jgi:internalin A
VNRRNLEDKYPKIRGFIETDCEDGIGIDELKKMIKNETDHLEHLRDAFPSSWFAIKDKLAGMEENYLTFEQYRSICLDNGEGDSQAQDSLAFHLHNLGIALNYKDDPRLRDMHVLNPHWVTNGIYKIINSIKIDSQKGELSLDDLVYILDPKDYPPERHNFILELMRKFELSFRFPESEDHYLITDLLDKQQPAEADEFNPEECLNFQYHYPVMPQGILPRFIVRTHILSTDKPRWRTGVILEFEGNTALVKADIPDKKVHISIKGNASNRNQLLAVIRSDFDHINSSFEFQPDEMVPIPDYPVVFEPYNNLCVMEQNGIEKYPKVIGDKIVLLEVKKLLNGVDLERAKRNIRTTESQGQSFKLFYSYSHLSKYH